MKVQVLRQKQWAEHLLEIIRLSNIINNVSLQKKLEILADLSLFLQCLPVFLQMLLEFPLKTLQTLVNVQAHISVLTMQTLTPEQMVIFQCHLQLLEVVVWNH